MKRFAAALLGAVAVVASFAGPAGAQAPQNCTIALIPGLTTDAFYITMRKGARWRPRRWAAS
jgi:ribose transport system substrate-binding protein